MQGVLPALWLVWSGAARAQAPLPLPGAPTPPGAPALPGLPDDPGLPEAPDLPLPLPAPEPSATAPATFALSYQGEWWWVPTDPLAGAMTDVAIDPVRPTRWAAVTRGGGVWISNDDGISWVLGMPSATGATGGRGAGPVDVQRRVEDVISDIDVEAVGDYEAYDGSDTLEEAAGQIQQLMDELDEETSALGASRAPEQEAVSRLSFRSRVWFDGPRLFAGREDGLFVSPDGGATWFRLLDVATGALVRTPRGLVAGTADGMRYSGDGSAFFDVDDGSEGIPVLSLAAAADGELFAGTLRGLWSSTDGAFWQQRFAFEQPILEVAVDPDVPGRLWVSTPATILSSDDLGRSFAEPLTAPMPSVTDLIWLGTLHWVCASGDGVWETMNGGLSWAPIARGLTDPGTWGISAVDGRLALASEEGVLRIDRAPDLLYDPDAQAALLRDELAAWIPRDRLIGLALERTQLGARSGSVALATLLPRLTFRGEYRHIDGLDYNSGLDADDAVLDDSAGTIRIFDHYWAATLELRWAPVGRKQSAFGDSFADVSEADYGISLDGVSGADGDEGLRRDSAVYAGDVARRVGELYTARAEALQRRVAIARAPLLQQVQLELHILELEASLDALTDGAVSAWDGGSGTPRSPR